jgi:LPXTG-motif cell wall-anchored protein
VVHANPDDDRTDPAGNSGARIACGVIALVGPGGLPRTGEAGPATLALAALGLALLVGGAALRRTRRA